MVWSTNGVHLHRYRSRNLHRKQDRSGIAIPPSWKWRVLFNQILSMLPETQSILLSTKQYLCAFLAPFPSFPAPSIPRYCSSGGLLALIQWFTIRTCSPNERKSSILGQVDPYYCSFSYSCWRATLETELTS